MNICFITSSEVAPNIGGTERITSSISQALSKKYGIKCYSIFSEEQKGDLTLFEGKLKVENFTKDEDRIVKFIEDNHISVLINQGNNGLYSLFNSLKKKISNCKLVFVYHFEPGWGKHTSFKVSYLNWKNNPTMRGVIRLALFPVWSIKMKMSFEKSFRMSYINSDRFVLLSESFKKQFINFAKLKNGDKLVAIPNCLSFDDFLPESAIQDKTKTVLVVSRMREYQKRISLVLKIWKEIEKDDALKDWKLKIIGDGYDLKDYQRYAKKHLQRVEFLGILNPEDYYKSSSLFMLTSRSEGWGLTLTEAQQNGCVPIAFDSYSSLHDIITDGYNGCIIPNNDIPQYVKSLKNLMLDDNKRCSLAGNAILSSHRFEKDKVAEIWYQLFKDLL